MDGNFLFFTQYSQISKGQGAHFATNIKRFEQSAQNKAALLKTDTQGRKPASLRSANRESCASYFPPKNNGGS